MMACTFSEGGLRVFDVRDLKHPREIAYYKPPAVGEQNRLASKSQRHPGTKVKSHTADIVTFANFANNAREIWFTSSDNGFQVVKFSDELIKRERDLFNRDVTCNGKLRDGHGCPQT